MISQPGLELREIPIVQSPLKHVAIIMDGNGRWAKQQGKDRTLGHQEGLKTTKNIVLAASELGIPVLSLYVFSTENWKRTQKEVGFLMDLLVQNLRKEYDFYKERSIKIIHSGDITGLPSKVSQELVQACEDTAQHEGLIVNLAINYGGRDELLRACNRAIKDNQLVLDEETLGLYVDNPQLPDVDLLIRSGGEKRLSNFLLWKSSYAELYFSEKLWPDWNKQDLENALTDYYSRKRRFGGL